MAVVTAKRILSPGTRIAGYRIEAEIGHGAMAVVYRARQLNLDRPVALKVLSDELAANHEFVSRFFNEARAAAALSHAHIVQAYDAGIAEGGFHFFAMEYVEGETLLRRIRQQGHIRPGPGIGMAIDIADALNYGWQRQGLTHGDIKPENIMINQAGESKLADFGLAKVAGHDFAGTDILLTPLYAAPERIRGEASKGDCRSDIYAFGATLYHMFGGTPPFPGEKALEVMQRHLNEALEPLRQRNPAVPGRISDLVGALLQKDGAQRPGDWEAVLASLRDIRKALTEPPAAKVVPAAAKPGKLRSARHDRAAAARSQQRSRSGWLVVGALLLLAGVAGLIAARRWPGLRLPLLHEAVSATVAATAAAPVGVPATPAAAAGQAVAASWEEVRQQALAESDPERALVRLEDYGRRHAAQGLPADYETLLAGLRAGGRDHPGTPTGTPAVAQAGGGTTGPTVGAEPRVVPADSDAGAALGPAGPDGGSASAAGLATAPPRAAPATASSEIPQTPAEQRVDALVTYLGKLAGFEYRFPLHIEASMKEGQDWLLNFADESAEKEAVTFIVGTVLPALEEALPKLAANSGVLVGVKMPGREYANCTVAGVDVKELALREQTQYGVASRKLSWQRLDNPASLVLYLSQKVALRGTTWAGRRPLLALILLSRNAKLFDEAVKGLPEVPEKADWERLRLALGRATAESRALHLWQRAIEARREGERTAAYRLLLELQATRSGVSERYGERARRLAAEMSGGVPEVAGGALLREGAARVGSDPGGALAKVMLAWSRYGAADFPEKAGMEALRRRAVAGLPLEGWQLQQVRRQPQYLIVPFAQPTSAGVPCLALRMYQAASEARDGLVPGQADLLAALEGPALLEFGDWADSERLVAKLQENVLAALPPPARAATWFSRGLTEARFGAVAEKPITEALRQCTRELAGKADSEFVLLPQILALEYGLFLRSGEPDLQPYLAGGGALSPRGPTAALRARLILDLAALSVDRRQTDAVARLVPAVFASTDPAPDWGLEEAGLALARLAVSRPRDSKTLLAAMDTLDRHGSTEWHLRLIASMALARDGLDDGVWRRANEWINLQSMSFGPVGGSAVYDLVLARIGHRLAAGDLQGADDTAAWALALPSPCLVPYYARLVFSRWGVARLRGGGGRRELAEQVEAATGASRQEKAISRLFRGDAQRDKAREAVRGFLEGTFWLDWLSTVERLAGASAKEDSGSLARFAPPRLPRAEQILASGLVAWAERQTPAKPGQDRNQPITP